MTQEDAAILVLMLNPDTPMHKDTVTKKVQELGLIEFRGSTPSQSMRTAMGRSSLIEPWKQQGSNTAGFYRLVSDWKGRIKCRSLRTTNAHLFPNDPVKNLPEEIDFPLDNLREGAAKQITINAFERNQEARRKCLMHHGYHCAVCQFLFEQQFGEIGRNYIHVHHLVPISDIQVEYKIDPQKDLRPVCPNCHAMLHRKTPPYSIEELQEIRAAQGKK